MEINNLIKCFDEKINSGYRMIEQLKLIKNVEGVDKLIRKIEQEVKFLKKVHSTGNIKKEHLQSTNLIHLNAIVNRLLSANLAVHVLKSFKYQNSKLEIDIICDNGSSWVKVIARNARALTLISKGDTEYGQKSIFDQANSYIKYARKNPYMYHPPNVIFHFAHGIEKPLANKLENLLSIKIEGKKIDVIEYDSIKHEKLIQAKTEFKDSSNINISHLVKMNTNFNSSDTAVLNLDVSTLLAWVTNMTNGHANFIYKEPLLTMQAKWEQCRPIRSVLDKLFENKKLVVCQTAFDNFTNIVNLIGGPNEKKRAHELRYKIMVVNDIPKGRIMNLNLIGKIKMRSRLVFASGENLKSITVSANEGFVRAARMQGIECMVFLHEPRSLSEVKEVNGTIT